MTTPTAADLMDKWAADERRLQDEETARLEAEYEARQSERMAAHDRYLDDMGIGL